MSTSDPVAPHAPADPVDPLAGQAPSAPSAPAAPAAPQPPQSPQAPAISTPLPGGVVAGMRDATPAGLVALPLGLAFGLVIAQSGLAWWWGTLFAAVVFAGSFEFLLLTLVTAGTPLLSIALTAVLVNVRHVFYSLSFPLHRVPGPAKLYSTYALTDEAFALTARPEAHRWRGRRILALQATFHLAWTLSVTAGALLGTRLTIEIPGLDFALTALFVVLCVDAFRARRDLPALVVAVGCAIVAKLVLGSDMMLLGGIVLFAAFVIVRFTVRRRREVAADA